MVVVSGASCWLLCASKVSLVFLAVQYIADSGESVVVAGLDSNGEGTLVPVLPRPVGWEVPRIGECA